MRDKLKELVRIADDGVILKISFHKARFLGLTHITDNEGKIKEIFINIEYLEGLFKRRRKLSIPDLILNADFMKALYGDDCTYRVEEGNYDEILPCVYGECSGDNMCYFPRYQHIALIAASLYLDSPEKAVDYMYDNLPKERL